MAPKWRTRRRACEGDGSGSGFVTDLMREALTRPVAQRIRQVKTEIPLLAKQKGQDLATELWCKTFAKRNQWEVEW